jgi:hypothetical protein
LPGPSNAGIGMPSPPPSNPARRRLRKGKQGCLGCSPITLITQGERNCTAESARHSPVSPRFSYSRYFRTTSRFNKYRQQNVQPFGCLYI